MKIFIIILGSVFFLTTCSGEKTEKNNIPGAEVISNISVNTPIITEQWNTTISETPFRNTP